VLLVKLVPQALALPSPQNLRGMNDALQAEVAERKHAEANLKKLNDDLERRVQERTVELERANHALEERQQRLALIQGIAGIGTWEWDIARGVGACTDEYFELHGLTRSPGQAAPAFEEWLATIHPDDRAAAVEARRNLETVETSKLEYRVVRPGGGIDWLAGRYWMHRNQAGHPVRVIGVAIRITERKKVEEELRKSEQQLRTVLDALPVGVSFTDRRGNIVLGNPAGQRIWGGAAYIGVDHYRRCKGWSRKTGKPIPPDDWGLVRALKNGETSLNEVIDIEALDGTRKTLDSSALPIRDEHGAIIGGLVVNVDVTEQIQAQESLKEQRDTTRALLESASQAILTVAENGTLVDANRVAERMFGYSKEDLLGQSIELLVPETVRDLHVGHRAEFHRNPRVRAMGARRDLTARRKDSSELPVEISLSYVTGKRGTLAVAFVTDITERKRAEQELRASEQRFRQIVETAAEGILTTDANGRATFVNQRLSDMLGVAQEEILGKSMLEFVYIDDRPAAIERFRAGHQATLYSYDFRLCRSDGSPVWVSSSANPLHDDAGAFAGVLAMFTDISERKRAEEALIQQAQDLARSNADLQQFAYITSHDLQEPLRTVATFSQLLERRYKGKLDPDADQLIGFVTDGALRMQALISDLLVYSRVGIVEKQVTNVSANEAVKWALENLDSALRESGATVAVAPLPEVQGDKVELMQLFQNLISNAIKYRGKAPPQIEITATREQNKWMFAVRDNGAGIAPAYHEQIFGLFKRLDRDKPGTGLGLAICKKIVERYGGRIWIDSAAGEGSTFYFTLPADGGSPKLESVTES
jgi:PAS domain S-box-containing protein